MDQRRLDVRVVRAPWISIVGTVANHPHHLQLEEPTGHPHPVFQFPTWHPCRSHPPISFVCCRALSLLVQSFEQMLRFRAFHSQELHHNAAQRFSHAIQLLVGRFYLIRARLLHFELRFNNNDRFARDRFILLQSGTDVITRRVIDPRNFHTPLFDV